MKPFVKFIFLGAVLIFAAWYGSSLFSHSDTDGRQLRKNLNFDKMVVDDEAEFSNMQQIFEGKSKNFDLPKNAEDTNFEDRYQSKIYKEASELLKDRIVHLDLKGAAPRVEYLKRIFPFFRVLGATGLLIEWEDTFPYHGDLQAARNAEGYTDEDIQQILKAAKESNLKIIPLIQTFGHMEWILKKSKYADVREIRKIPQVICPSNGDSFSLIKMIIDDVIKSHKGFIDALHIGSDEAYRVGKECDRCKKAIEKLGSVEKVMLQHVKKVAQYVKETHGLRVLMWNDMFENTSVDALRASGIENLIEPVIWGYAPNLMKKDYFPTGLFDRFGAAFPSIWIASAFKGANGPDQTFVDVPKYAANHMSWLSLLHNFKKSLRGVTGAILTGWQRFDHFAILCELLPAAIPSLAVDLQLFQTGTHQGVRDKVLTLLNCDSLSNWTDAVPEWTTLIEVYEKSKKVQRPPPPYLNTVTCNFPGSEVYALVERLRVVSHDYVIFTNSSAQRGWMSEYNVKHQYGSVFHAERAQNRSQALLDSFREVGRNLRQELNKIYFDDTVDEWLYENVQVYMDRLKEISLAAVQIMHTVEFRNRPLTHVDMDI